MNKIKIRSQVDKLLNDYGFDDATFDLERERLLYPARLKIYDKNNALIIDMTTPTVDKLKKELERIKE